MSRAGWRATLVILFSQVPIRLSCWFGVCFWCYFIISVNSLIHRELCQPREQEKPILSLIYFLFGLANLLPYIMLEFNNDEKKCNNEIFPAPSAVRVERGGAGQRRSSPELLLHLRSVDTVDPAAGNQARVGLDSLELFAEC